MFVDRVRRGLSTKTSSNRRGTDYWLVLAGNPSDTPHGFWGLSL